MNEWQRVKASTAYFDRSFLQVMGIDALYVLIVVLLSDLNAYLTFATTGKWNALIVDKMAVATNPAVLEQNLGAATGFIGRTILVIILFYVVHALVWGGFSYWSWSTLAKKAYTKKAGKAFVKKSSLWILGWMITFTLLLAAINAATYTFVLVFFALLFLFMLTTCLLHKHLIKGKAYSKMLEETLAAEWGPPVGSGVVVFILGYALFGLLSRSIPGFVAVFDPLFGLFLLTFFTWWKRHLYTC